MKKKIILIALITIAGLSINRANAQEQSAPQPSASQPATVVATVNIHNAKIIAQENNKFQISFDLSNRVIVQPEVKYSVVLKKQDGQNQLQADEKIYAEVVNLGENQTLAKQITYEAPTQLSGDFQLWLFAKNAAGQMLAVSSLGEVQLSGQPSEIEDTAGFFDKYKFYGLALVILIIFGLAVFLMRRKSAMLFFLFSIMGLGIIFSADTARAETYIVGSNGWDNYTVSLDKATYFPGESIEVDFLGQWQYFNNSEEGSGLGVFPSARLRVSINNVGTDFGEGFYDNVDYSYINIYNHALGYQTETESFTAPSSPESYTALVEEYYVDCERSWDNECIGLPYGAYRPIGNIPYTVVAPAASGSCAATHYNCSAGALGATAEYADQWQWWCNGSNGGSNVLCSEAKPINGVCGNANGIAYSYGSASYSPYAQCSAGSPSTIAFPSAGNSVSWTCSGSNGGSSSGTCSASQNAPASCTPPWGGSVASGGSVTAYLESSVTSPATCTSETRTCSNGTLSGNYTNQSCSVNYDQAGCSEVYDYAWATYQTDSEGNVIGDIIYSSECSCGTKLGDTLGFAADCLNADGTPVDCSAPKNCGTVSYSFSYNRNQEAVCLEGACGVAKNAIASCIEHTQFCGNNPVPADAALCGTPDPNEKVQCPVCPPTANWRETAD